MSKAVRRRGGVTWRLPTTGVLLFAGLLGAAAPAGARFDPGHHWRRARTPHFELLFHEGEEQLAARAAQIAEEVHPRLVARLGWAPRSRTRLVIVDDYDAAQGYATPYPYNQIVVYPTPPVEEPGYLMVPVDEWLRLVITHEYTHLLQLDMVAGFPRALQRVFGRLYFPNVFQPSWLIEGLATYEETELTAGGRGLSPAAEMVLRMAALAGRLPGLDRLAVAPDDWPAGQVPYLFGESFIRHLAERYGREKVADLSLAYSGRTVPFLVDSTGRRVLGERYGPLWREWAEGLRARGRALEQRLREEGLTYTLPLTSTGFLTAFPAWSPDGTRIAYQAADNHRYPGLWLMRADGSGRRRLVKNVFSGVSSGGSIAWSPDGTRIYYTRLEVRRNAALVNDLYAYDLLEGGEVRLTRGLRARDPHPSPDGSRLVFVTGRLGTTRLAVLDLARRDLPVSREEQVRFLTPPSAAQYASPRWSPDGTRIAVSVWRPGGAKDIWILDAAGARTAEIAHDRALDGAPAWSADGRRLFFSSDRSGIFNLYAWEAATGEIRRVTNVVGGAFCPAPSPDGKTLAFAAYGAAGFDVHLMKLDPAAWRPAPPSRGPEPEAPPAAGDAPPLASAPYSPLPTLLPRLWVPWFGSSGESGFMPGLFTFGQDAAQRHRYFLTGLYGPSSGRVAYQFDYVYDGWLPTLRLGAADLDVTHAEFLDDGTRDEEDYVERERTLGADLTLPLVRIPSQHYLTLGYRHRRRTALTDLPPWEGYGGPLPEEGAEGSLRLAYLFNNAHRYGASISPEGGRSVALGVERSAPGLGGELTLTRYTGDWQEFLDLPWGLHHVLQGRLFAGVSTGERLPQGAFQLGGDSPGDLTLSLDDRAVHLRGYPPNSFRGRNAALAGLEYRFPILDLQRGPGSGPVFLRRFHGAVFVETGNAWDGTFRGGELKTGVGTEARLDLTLAYLLPVTLRAGVAAGLDEKGEVLPYLGLWIPWGAVLAGSGPGGGAFPGP